MALNLAGLFQSQLNSFETKNWTLMALKLSACQPQAIVKPFLRRVLNIRSPLCCDAMQCKAMQCVGQRVHGSQILRAMRASKSLTQALPYIVGEVSTFEIKTGNILGVVAAIIAPREKRNC